MRYLLLRCGILGPLLCQSAVIAQQSPYVQRMMSLDRNSDGQLAADELPGKLADLINQHDQNADGKLSPAELSRMETAAKAARDARPSDDDTAARGRRSGGRRGRGPRGRANAQPGSPLDTKQILKFALTFDADADGGLNAAELQKYAAALAVRRADARRRRAAEDEPAQPESSKDSGAIKSSKPPGLKADGSGGGGFGDTPSGETVPPK